jgi:GT2 family glycosyltransferase
MDTSATAARLWPTVDFPVTVCVVCYGPHFGLAERFLTSLYQQTSPTLFRLRAGLNEVVPETLQLFQSYRERYGNIDLFIEPKNRFKNPLMRRMFTEQPLTSRWVIWFDDDSYVSRPDWLSRLATRIETKTAVAQWGQTYGLWRTDEEIHDFIQNAPWYRQQPLLRGQNLDGQDAYEFRFATGGFWAMKSDVIGQLDWPDPRLIHANEDFLLGEALRQNGHTIGLWEYGVVINAADRRNADAPEVVQLMQ